VGRGGDVEGTWRGRGGDVKGTWRGRGGDVSTAETYGIFEKVEKIEI